MTTLRAKHPASQQPTHKRHLHKPTAYDSADSRCAQCGYPMYPEQITPKDVSVSVGHETIECAALIDVSPTTLQRVRMRYSGYTKRQAVAAFVAYVNAGGR